MAKKVQTDFALSQRKKAEEFLSLFSRNLYETAKNDYIGKKSGLFILPFYVEADDKEKTSHYIVFISKAHKAIQEMRRVMIKQSNSDSMQLGFDSKDELQISLLNRSDDSAKSIAEVIKIVFSTYPQFYSNKYTVANLSERIDRYEMFTAYRVFPYSLQEIKYAVQELYKKGCIEIVLPPDKRIKSAITDKSLQIKSQAENEENRKKNCELKNGTTKRPPQNAGLKNEPQLVTAPLPAPDPEARGTPSRGHSRFEGTYSLRRSCRRSRACPRSASCP